MLALGLALAACKNDTGQPKSPPAPPTFGGGGPTGMFGTGGFGVAGAGTPVPGVAMDAGTAKPPVTVADTGSGPICAVAADDANGIVSSACVSCACAMKPAETLTCTRECWRLLVCVSQHCDRMDTNCIIAQCADDVGGAANLANIGAQARAVPFLECAPQCIPDDISDGGPLNDQ